MPLVSAYLSQLSGLLSHCCHKIVNIKMFHLQRTTQQVEQCCRSRSWYTHIYTSPTLGPPYSTFMVVSTSPGVILSL